MKYKNFFFIKHVAKGKGAVIYHVIIIYIKLADPPAFPGKIQIYVLKRKKNHPIMQKIL